MSISARSIPYHFELWVIFCLHLLAIPASPLEGSRDHWRKTMARETRDGKIVVIGEAGEHIRIAPNQGSGGGVTLTITDDSGNALFLKSYDPEEAENLTVSHDPSGSLDCDPQVPYNISFETHSEEDDYFTVIKGEDGQVTIEDPMHIAEEEREDLPSPEGTETTE
jgi:mannose-6-phosphate isomerase-like protein (cupin superfamily)